MDNQQFDLYGNSQQLGTLNYNRGPELWVDNGKSIAVAEYDEVQIQRKKSKKKVRRYV